MTFKLPKPLWWIGALAALVVAAHIGTTPRRSDDLRVALLPQCPVARGGLESGAGAAEIAAALGDAVAGAAIKSALQVARAYGQAQVSAPRSGATAEHFHLLLGRGDIVVNKQIWSCLVVSVGDLRPASAAPADGGPPADAHTRDRVYLEARIVHAADGSAFELQPVTLRFREAADASVLGSAARDLRFDIDFVTPGNKEPFARATLDFAALVPGADAQWGVDRLGAPLAKRSGWLSAPAVGKALDDRARALKAEAAKPKAEPARASAQTPSTVHVTLVETREASVLWKFVANLLEAFEGKPAASPAAAPPAAKP
jgi:hypothetical protein